MDFFPVSWDIQETGTLQEENCFRVLWDIHADIYKYKFSANIPLGIISVVKKILFFGIF